MYVTLIISANNNSSLGFVQANDNILPGKVLDIISCDIIW